MYSLIQPCIKKINPALNMTGQKKVKDPEENLQRYCFLETWNQDEYSVVKHETEAFNNNSNKNIHLCKN